MSFDAHEDKVMEMFNRKVYNIPRNQRKYVWTKTNWQELFDDIMAVVDGKIQSHFIGSIVLEEKPMKNGLPQFLIIDGQQEVYLEMKKAIDVAWTNRTPEVIAAQRRLGFGDEPPTPEEYVMKVSLDVRREMDEEELS